MLRKKNAGELTFSPGSENEKRDALDANVIGCVVVASELHQRLLEFIYIG